MIKVLKHGFEVGLTFKLRNAWRDKIIEALSNNGIKDEKYPFTFKIEDIDEKYYLCKSVSDKKTDKIRVLLVTEEILAYLTGAEVDNVNVGLYLTDYIPDENSKLLFCNKKELSKINPVKLITTVEVDKAKNGDTEELNCIDNTISILEFKLLSLINNKVTCLGSESKNSWKLLHGSSDYMTDVEKMYQDTFIHKGIVLEVCNRFAKYLEEHGQEKDAEILREKAIVHDNSKILNKDEFEALTSIINDKSSMIDASKQLSQYKVDAIELHWKNNEHHKEHFADGEDMGRNNRQEMACDCCARSIQYGTDLFEFMKVRQEERFHFNEEDFDEIMRYCKVLVDITSDL